ncbi:hypothetical protein ATER59S_00417 [Aquamicrobium terrae]
MQARKLQDVCGEPVNSAYTSFVFASNLAEVVSRPLPAQAGNPVEEQNTFDVVDLMLNADGKGASGVQQVACTLQVQIANRNLPVSRHRDAVAGHRKTALFTNDCFRGAADDFWIHHRNAMPSFGTVRHVQNHQTQWLADLHGGKPHALFAVHDGKHLRCEMPNIGVNRLYPPGGLRKQGIVNRQNWIIGHSRALQKHLHIEHRPVNAMAGRYP